ncbi:hypothetical protein, partial [Novacetimonas pomaceti]|uniref:hypothetical protein n=1 Tax=Novacetimonas pomaceti TaxID=2021998 RepID=UPI001C2D6D74
RWGWRRPWWWRRPRRRRTPLIPRDGLCLARRTFPAGDAAGLHPDFTPGPGRMRPWVGTPAHGPLSGPCRSGLHRVAHGRAWSRRPWAGAMPH